MFSIVVLFFLFICSLVAVWLLMGKVGLFSKVGKSIKSLEKLFEEKKEND